MTNSSPSEPTRQTRDAERREAATPHEADRGPTEAEEELAEDGELTDEKKNAVADHYKEMSQIGAEVEGEGQIP